MRTINVAYELHIKRECGKVCARSSYCYFANLQWLELGTGKVDINCHPNSVGMNEIANIVKNSF